MVMAHVVAVTASVVCPFCSRRQRWSHWFHRQGANVLELREIECLITLSEQLHFGRTGSKLRISQSRVSRLLRDAEQKVGGQLFERSSRHVRMTALGKLLIDRLWPLHEGLNDACADAVALSRGTAGTARLGFTGAAGGGYAARLIRSARAYAPARTERPRVP